MKKIFLIMICLCVCLVLCSCLASKIDVPATNGDNQDKTKLNSEQISAEKIAITEICINYYNAMYYETLSQGNENILKYIMPGTKKYDQMKSFDKIHEFRNTFDETFEYADYVDVGSIDNLVSVAGLSTQFEVSDILVRNDTAKVDIKVKFVNPATIDNLDNEYAITEYLALKGTDYETYAAEIDAMSKEEYEEEKKTFYKEYGEFLMTKALEKVQNGVLSEKTVTENLVKVDGQWYIS